MAPSAPLDLVHVVRQYRPGIGGLETFVEQLARAQLAEGHRVRVVTLDRIFDSTAGRLPAHEMLDGVEVRRIPFRGSRRYPIAPSVKDQLGSADIVHVHGIDFFADFLAMTSRKHRRPLLVTTHGGFFHTGFAKRLKRFYFATITRASLSRYDAVVACSVDDERTFRRIAGERVTLIGNKVDLAIFAGLADRGAPDILYFGRIAPNKEVERLLRWFAGLAKHDPTRRLFVAGKPMRESLKRLAQVATDLGISDRVEFHDTPNDDTLRKLIARCGSYACASSYEGFGLAAIEAASAGLYPVLSAIGPFESHIDTLGFGTLVDFEQPSSWAQSYARFEAGERAFRHDIGPAILAERLAPYDLSTMAHDYERVYRRILAKLAA